METEEKAKAMGWVPKEEFRGDENKWVDAEEFVKRGENFVGIAKENIDRLTQKVTSLESKLEESTKVFQEFREFATKSEQRAYDRAQKEYESSVKDLKKRLKEAAKNEQWSEFDEIENEIDGLEKPQKLKKKDDKQKATYYTQADLDAWMGANTKWFNVDQEMTAYAVAMEPILIKQGKKGQELFEEIDKRLQKRFPENYENPNKKKPSSVDGGGGDGEEVIKKDGKYSFNDIKDTEERKDARASYQRFKKELGFDKNGKEYTEQEYLKVYFGGK